MLKPAVAAAAVLVGAWFVGGTVWGSFFQNEAHLTYSIDAKFEVDGFRYQGSAVWEMKHWVVKFPATAGPYFKVRGEAIALTGGPKNLFLLRRRVGGTSGDAYGGLPYYCVPPNLPNDWTSVDWVQREFSGPCEVSLSPRAKLPTLIEISALDDPTSIQELVYTVGTADESCTSPCLRALVVARSELPITTGIERRLPWLQKYEFGMTDVLTGAVVRSSGPSMGPMLIDFSTELGNGRLYGP